MKAEFHKDLKNLRSALYFLCLLLILFISFMSNNRTTYVILIVYFPLFTLFLRSYKITDEDVLTGHGEKPIKNIQKIVIQPDGWFKNQYCIDLYYVPKENEKINIKKFYPKDKDLFISSLKEINPSIEII